MAATFPGRFDCKVRRERKPEIQVWIQLKNQKIRGLHSRKTLKSNRSGELAVTQEARHGDLKPVFHFLQIYVLKNTAN